MTIKRYQYTITGVVQGVGFRPFIYRLAVEHNLTGLVYNAASGVHIEVQGEAASLVAFDEDIVSQLPPLAKVVSCLREDMALASCEKSFVIEKSFSRAGHSVFISPDVAICSQCLSDITSPENRRYQYSFTNCTNCGPRYTITRSIPYDRPKTSMACFPLCPACQKEYDDPLDRRFHAQPNACPGCGPELWATDKQGQDLAKNDKAIQYTVQCLHEGKTAAVKGLGGFHLVCDATSETAVSALRRAKQRKAKPLAVMIPDMETAHKIAHINKAEEHWLTGNKRPIVLCEKKNSDFPAPCVAPDTGTIGLMLPYTPLHFLLFSHYQALCEDRLPVLVMTSGNFSSEPISLGNREALERLHSLADVFLLHNRDILIRCDDSVVQILEKKSSPEKKDTTQFLRRARGFTPAPVFLSQKGPSVLALGAELKSTMCFTKEDKAFVSQHIGDLENLETFGFYKEIKSHLQDILQVNPVAVVCDKHPDYMSTAYAGELGLALYKLQHHVAHTYAVMAENKFDGACIGVSLDGTGYGEDNTLWGGEVLLVDNEALTHSRMAQFLAIPLPGGEAAIREPWRIAQSFLHRLGHLEPEGRPWPWLEHGAEASSLVTQALKRDINAPLSSSCGRLFDAVSAMLGLVHEISYEAQAAVLLEAIQDKAETYAYTFPVLEQGDMFVFNSLELFTQVYEDWKKGVHAGVISRRFHLGLIQGLARAVCRFSGQTGIKHTGLSGGVMLNKTIATLLPEAIVRAGGIPLTHSLLPPGDGSISLGQALYGMRKVQAGG